VGFSFCENIMGYLGNLKERLQGETNFSPTLFVLV
jgi:hypothetical protein